MVKEVGKVFKGFFGLDKAAENFAAPTQVNMPPGLQPAKTPASKPAAKTSMQSSFLSGASMAGAESSGGTRGKTLLGA